MGLEYNIPQPNWSEHDSVKPAVCPVDMTAFSCLAMISAPWSEQYQLCGLSKSTRTHAHRQSTHVHTTHVQISTESEQRNQEEDEGSKGRVD